MKNILKITGIFSLVFITLVFSISFTRCGGGEKSTDEMENALRYIAENLDDATYSPIGEGWSYDYGLKEGWILSKFEYIRSLITYKEFQAKSGYPIYLSGPHTKDELNLNSKYTFGHYNPKFVKLLHKATLSLTSNKAFINNTKPLLEEYGILDFLYKHKEVYEITQKYPDEYQQIKSDFIKRIKDETWEEGGYREMIPEQIYSEYYWNWSETSYHFWVRRDIDETIDLWTAIISDVLDAYDY